VRRNRLQPAPGQLGLPLGDAPPEPERKALPRGWAPEGPTIIDVEAQRREREAAQRRGPPEG
jgi:hypothetical protein